MNSSDFLPTGSPIPSSSHAKTQRSPGSVKAKRKSSEINFFGDFGFRIVTNRSLGPEDIIPKQENSPKGASQFSENISSDDDDELELGNFELTPEKPRQFEKDHTVNLTFGSVVKTAAVSALGKLPSDEKTKYLCNNIYANFFKIFDEWNRKREKERKNQKKDETQKSSSYDQLSIAQNKLNQIIQEEERWHKEYEISEDVVNATINKSPKSVRQKVHKINIEHNNELTKLVITQLDPLQAKIQKDYSTTSNIEKIADDIAVIIKEISQ